MASNEVEQSQSGVEEMGVGGPGAPTPLSALEVCLVMSRTLPMLTLYVRALPGSQREIFN